VLNTISAVCPQDRLVDVNVKVAEKALSVLLDLLRCVKLKIVPHLDKLVPNIFLKLADAKPSIRQLANAALVKISQDFGGDTLYPVILRVLEIEERAAAVHASNVLVQQQRQLAQVYNMIALIPCSSVVCACPSPVNPSCLCCAILRLLAAPPPLTPQFCSLTRLQAQPLQSAQLPCWTTARSPQAV